MRTFDLMKRKLIIVRHAKSAWSDADLSDFDRPLNKRGEADAPFMAQRYCETEERPHKIVSSSALRCKTTAGYYADALGIPSSEIELKPEIYEAPLSRLIEVVNGLDDAWQTVLLFGHNPGMSYLIDYLSGEMVQMPTNGVACIELDIEQWKHAGNGCGTLVYNDYPKRHQIES